jgi:hypothetical protein
MTRPTYAFTANKKGQAIAYRWDGIQARWFRTQLAAAQLAVVTGQADEETYRPNTFAGLYA